MDKEKFSESLKRENKIFLSYLAGYADDIDVLAELAYYAKNQKLKTEDCLEFEGYTASKLKELLPDTRTTEIYYYMRKLKHNPEFKTIIKDKVASKEYHNSDEYKKMLELANMSDNEKEWNALLNNLKKLELANMSDNKEEWNALLDNIKELVEKIKE